MKMISRCMPPHSPICRLVLGRCPLASAAHRTLPRFQRGRETAEPPPRLGEFWSAHVGRARARALRRERWTDEMARGTAEETRGHANVARRVVVC